MTLKSTFLRLIELNEFGDDQREIIATHCAYCETRSWKCYDLELQEISLKVFFVIYCTENNVEKVSKIWENIPCLRSFNEDDKDFIR